MRVNHSLNFIANNKLVTDQQLTIESLGLQPFSTILLAGPLLLGGMTDNQVHCETHNNSIPTLMNLEDDLLIGQQDDRDANVPSNEEIDEKMDADSAFGPMR